MTMLTERVRPRLGWQQHANCRTSDEYFFFAPEGEPPSIRRRREVVAKRICANCPVLAECRTHAILSGEPHGVWGGLSEHERLHHSTS